MKSTSSVTHTMQSDLKETFSLYTGLLDNVNAIFLMNYLHPDKRVILRYKRTTKTSTTEYAYQMQWFGKLLSLFQKGYLAIRL